MENVIGTNIKSFRIKMGLNQQEIADYCDVSRELISLYESGKREVSLLHLEKISEYMNVDMEIFIEEDPREIKPDLALVFRANDLTPLDREGIAFFKKIVKNYLKMKKIANGIQA